MFLKTYKATIKTIVRSPLIWATVTLMIGFGIFNTLKSQYAIMDISTQELIWDTDSRFVLTYERYIQKLLNTMWTEELMYYIVPLLCVIVSGVVLVRDWRDNLFEIERAGDVRTASYFWGRFSAVFTFCTVAALFEELMTFHLYYITRGGLAEMGLWDYLIDSNIRVLRMFIIVVIPGILIFIGLTFIAGNLTKSGMIGMIIGSSYVLFEYLAKATLAWRLPDIYKDYLTPTSKNLYQYWTFFETEWFDIKWPYNPFSTSQMFLCLGILYSTALIMAFGSYLCVRRRKY